MSEDRFDAIVIGGGHNGLISAGYLARAGWRVLVLERRSLVGGACVTEEIFPGFKVSTAAYVCSLLRPRIIRDLKLPTFGYQVLLRDPSSFSPFPDNRHLFFWQDGRKTKEEISRFSNRDAQRFEQYEAELTKAAATVEPLLDAPPPKPTSRRTMDQLRLLRTGLRVRPAINLLTRLFSMSVADYLDRWFESPELKARLATDGVIGALAGPRTPGTAYILLHHVMGETGGQRGVWGYVRGGMGTITQALAGYVQSKGGVIITDAPVKKVMLKQGRCEGVVLEDGREYRAPVVLSNADPQRTFLQLFDALDLPEEFLRDIQAMRFGSGVVKINVKANGLPNFLACPGEQPGPQHRGTIHFCPSVDYIERAYDEAKWGAPSSRPVVEMCIPSVADDTLAPPGQHFISLFVQYAPYHRTDGVAWGADADREFAQRVFAVIREYVTNWDAIVDDYQVLSPKGLEDRFGLTGGNIFHGEMTLDQLLYCRPSPGWANYAMPIKGFYLCGSGAHPGGGVLGAPGLLAAQQVLRDHRFSF